VNFVLGVTDSPSPIVTSLTNDICGTLKTGWSYSKYEHIAA